MKGGHQREVQTRQALPDVQNLSRTVRGRTQARPVLLTQVQTDQFSPDETGGSQDQNQERDIVNKLTEEDIEHGTRDELQSYCRLLLEEVDEVTAERDVLTASIKTAIEQHKRRQWREAATTLLTGFTEAALADGRERPAQEASTMIDIKGRPRRSYVVKLIPGEGCLLIRLDDDDDDKFWQEMRIPETELLRMVAHVHRLTHAPQLREPLPLPDLQHDLPTLENPKDLPPL